MINVSNAFKQELFNDNRDYLEYADITLSDGTKLNLTNRDFWQGGVKIEDAVSSESSFDIGSAIINKCTLVIENLDDRFSDYDFTFSEVVVYIGLTLPDDRIEKIRKGTYTVDEAKYNGSIITLSCLDNMMKFDKAYSESKLTYPASLGEIVRNACFVCDVTLQSQTFPHSDYIVQTRPTDEATTFREIISWVAQIAGCFARCDTLGRLELKWYNQELLEKRGYNGGIFDGLDKTVYKTGDTLTGGSFNPWNDGDTADGGTFQELEAIHHIYSNYSAPVVSTDDIVITGVKVLEKNKDSENKEAISTYLSGQEGYVVSVENNDLIHGGEGLKISNWLGEQLIGFRFRKAQLSHASDPTIEAGDVGYFSDRKQNSYPIIISSTKFSTGGAQTTVSAAKDPIRNSAARFSAETKNYVENRQLVQNERTEREKALEDLGTRIDNSSGLYTTEQTQSDGSKIFFLHDKPTLDESMIVWKMTAEAWGVSTDGGKTYNGGMTVDGDTIVRILTAVGINAEWINTGQLVVRNVKGDITFFADCETGRVEIKADTFSLTSGETIESIAEDAAGNAVNDFVRKTYDPKIADLQKQLDGQIESFYYDYAPTLSNAPANGWKSEELKARHEGDLFFNKTTGLAYRFFKDTSGWTWQLIKDNDISKAIADASKAQDTADGKRRTFLTQPTPPYDKGDLWYGGTSSDVKVCTNSRQSGSYVSGDWSKRDKYIDQSAANTAASNAVSALSQTDVLDKLTNGGADKGIYLQNGKLYISFNAARGGELTLGGANNGNGILKVLDASGKEIGRWDASGIVANGRITATVLTATQTGTLGPWSFTSDAIYRSNSTHGARGGMYFGTKGLSISDTFVIDSSGNLSATNATLSGGSLATENFNGTYALKISQGTIDFSPNTSSYAAWIAGMGGSVDITVSNSWSVSLYDTSAGTASNIFSVRRSPKQFTCNLDSYFTNKVTFSGGTSGIANTISYANRQVYQNTATMPLVEDIGEAMTDENGECIVAIDDIFSETANLKQEYQVFLQKEGSGDVWVVTKEASFFIVKGTPNLKFSWILKAKQASEETVRLEPFNDNSTGIDTIPYSFDYEEEINQLIKEREEILYEYETA